MNQPMQGGRYGSWLIISRGDLLAYAQADYAGGVVELIVGKGRDQLRDSGGKRLRRSANPAVMDNRHGLPEKTAEWRVPDRLYSGRQ